MGVVFRFPVCVRFDPITWREIAVCMYIYSSNVAV